MKGNTIMMISPKEQITASQATVIVSNFILGTGVLILPRTSVENVKTPDVWITVILGGLIAMVAGVIIVKLSQQFPEKTFFQYSQNIVGKWFGGLLSLFMIGYFLITSGFQIRTTAEVTRLFLLEGTPVWAIIMPFMWVSLYLIIGGIHPIARLFEIIFPITIIIFFLVTFMSLETFEINNLLPVLGLGVEPVLKGIKQTALSFTGVEIMLILLAFMKQPNKAVKFVLFGTAIPLIFYVITVVMVIGALSVDGVVTRTWPTLDLIRSYEIAGLIFERFESLLLVIWIMQLFATFSISFFAAALGLSQLFGKNFHLFMYGLLPVIYIISSIPKNINDLFMMGDIIGHVALILFGLLPLLLLLITRFRRIKHDAKR
jgi:spore germination protein